MIFVPSLFFPAFTFNKDILLYLGIVFMLKGLTMMLRSRKFESVRLP